jgi:transcriptional regulator with XRE-family HTH domain
MNIGMNIQHIREAKNYSVSYMSIEMGISTKSYVNIESNERNVTLNELQHIAVLLETNISGIIAPGDVRKEPTRGKVQSEIELYSQLIKSKDELIDTLRNELDLLKAHQSKV